MDERLKYLIEEHVERRPEARVQDIYKLLYQGVFGVRHIISERAWDVLLEEANRIRLDKHLEDPLIEPVSPDESMIRVNLRQYINLGGDLRELYDVMRKSADYIGDDSIFLDYWSQFKRLVYDGEFYFPVEEIDEIDERVRLEGVKPMHHTEPYRIAYYPAYRVVLKEFFEELIDFDE